MRCVFIDDLLGPSRIQEWFCYTRSPSRESILLRFLTVTSSLPKHFSSWHDRVISDSGPFVGFGGPYQDFASRLQETGQQQRQTRQPTIKGSNFQGPIPKSSHPADKQDPTPRMALGLGVYVPREKAMTSVAGHEVSSSVTFARGRPTFRVMAKKRRPLVTMAAATICHVPERPIASATIRVAPPNSAAVA